MRVTYIGHATLLVEIGGQTLLTDPNFDETLGRFLPRVSKPGVALADLPALDAILLTHAHADHLSFRSLDQLPREIPLFAPPAVAAWLIRLGYSHAHPLPADGQVRVGKVVIHAAAAQHNGSRYSVDRWRSAANMYLIDAARETCFFAGDTALTPQTHKLVREIVHESDRGLDVALLPIGHAPWWKPGFRRGHLSVHDALHLFDRLQARYLIPYHWGTFEHVTSGAYDAINKLKHMLPDYARKADVRILEPGHTLEYRSDDPASIRDETAPRRG
jgi:L-ascorbate metabolism protein UlaG (beta-lactamase superfamily)